MQLRRFVVSLRVENILHSGFDHEFYPPTSTQPGHPSVVGAMSTSQRAVMLCGWGVKAGSWWVAGKTLWSPCYILSLEQWVHPIIGRYTSVRWLLFSLNQISEQRNRTSEKYWWSVSKRPVIRTLSSLLAAKRSPVCISTPSVSTFGHNRALVRLSWVYICWTSHLTHHHHHHHKLY